jgi:hypothetical protein
VFDADTETEKRLSPLRRFDLEDTIREMATSPTPRVPRLGVVSALFWAARRDPKVSENYEWLRFRNAGALRQFKPCGPVVEEYLAPR